MKTSLALFISILALTASTVALVRAESMTAVQAQAQPEYVVPPWVGGAPIDPDDLEEAIAPEAWLPSLWPADDR